MLTYRLTDTAEMRALEPWRAEEFAAYIERHRADLAPWLPWASSLTDVDSARRWLQRYADEQARGAGRIFGIWLDEELVGGTLFRNFDTVSSVAEIGVWLASQAQRRGLVTRAAERMIDWAVVERGIRRIEWRCVPDNAPSIAVAKRLGMTLEGVLRESFPYQGRHHDVQVWSLLAREWRTREEGPRLS